MTDGSNGSCKDRLGLMREAVYALERQMDCIPDPMSPECASTLFGPLGLDYSIHVVQRITSDLANATRRQNEQDESRHVP